MRTSLRFFAFLLPLALATCAFAQDERRVVSPDGRIEFRVFVGQPEPSSLPRLAYQVNVNGKPAIGTSFLGLDFVNQEPLLGENDGLIASSSSASRSDYHSLTVDYMQNGSIGRRIGLEVRAYNDGIAFRYVLPVSTPLQEFLLSDEWTEFRFASGNVAAESADPANGFPLPFVVEEPGIGWVAITEVRADKYPPMTLAHADGACMISRLAHVHGDPNVAFEGTTPMTGPWRLIVISPEKDRLMQAEIVRSLER